MDLFLRPKLRGSSPPTVLVPFLAVFHLTSTLIKTCGPAQQQVDELRAIHHVSSEVLKVVSVAMGMLK